MGLPFELGSSKWEFLSGVKMLVLQDGLQKASIIDELVTIEENPTRVAFFVFLRVVSL